MNRNTQKRCFIISFLLIIITILLTSGHKNSININKKEAISEKKEKQYVIKLADSKVSLFENGQIIKVYDIIPNALPGEDLLLLSNGIVVDSIAEANSIAEDFDG